MRKRNLSEFMCIEMLYDYKAGKLDPLRHHAVEEGLESSPRVRDELKKLNVGISYCDKLKDISVSEPLVDVILNQPKPVEKIFSKIHWSAFPQPVRWAFEAIVVAVAIALFVTQVPNLFKSEKSQSNSLIVKKFDLKPSEAQVIAETDISAEVVDKTADTASEKPEVSPVVDVKEKTLTKPIVASKEIPVLLRPLPKEVSVQEPKKVNVTGTTAQPAATAEAPAAKKGNAYVYRMTMYVEDVDTVTPEIVALITELGGQKAGEVELGWRRKGGSYFHFSLPQDNSPALQDGLKKYATFNIIKSAHPRVMPEGVERYILWVEKKNVTSSENTTSDSGQEEMNQENNETN